MVGWQIRRIVCPFVCLWVIMSVGLCVFQVCVCFLWAGVDYRLKAHVRVCCHSSVKDPCSTDSTPPRLFHLKFHRCIQAAQWQHVSIPALNFPAALKLLAKLQIGMLGLSLHSSWTSLLWFESLLKTFFSYFVIGRREALSYTLKEKKCKLLYLTYCGGGIL